jgi:hypothetical protein
LDVKKTISTHYVYRQSLIVPRTSMRRIFALLVWMGSYTSLAAQSDTVATLFSPKEGKKLSWVSIKGYTQLRYNELLETNPNLECEQCDKSWGTGLGIYVRRMRFSIDLQLLERLSFTVQPDIAGLLEGGTPVSTRDFYFQYTFDKKNEFRARLGQTRIPYGHENMQSTRSRIPLDRNDALNSSFINERDWGAFFYWTPERYQKQFEEREKNGLKGTGDYGVLSLGVFQGQSTLRDLNRNKHVVARLAYPLDLGKQLLEFSLQGYVGKYTIATAKMTEGVKTNDTRTYPDRRVALSSVLFPKPFGLQAEYNWGVGPEFTHSSGKITTQPLWGGYVLANYKVALGKQNLYPYVRAQHFDGAKKHERDARHYVVKELEFGIDWYLSKYVELIGAFTLSNRKFEDFRLPDNDQKGQLARIQLQVGF